ASSFRRLLTERRSCTLAVGKIHVDVFFFQAEDGIRDATVTGVQTCALPISPWSSKKLREAYEEGARLFGWRTRPPAPQRDGDWVIGHGMASCLMGTFRFPSHAHVTLRRDGTAVIEAGTQDIGTGTLTILPQIVADVL